jgi:hypothetical protein
MQKEKGREEEKGGKKREEKDGRALGTTKDVHVDIGGRPGARRQKNC